MICKLLFSSISEQNWHSGMQENLVLLCTQVNDLNRDAGKDIKVSVLKFVHRGYSSDIATSYYFRASKVMEHVASRVSGGEFKTK